MTHTPITVYPLPPRLETNPYLELLYGPMAGLGVQVRRPRARAALAELLRGGAGRILHLHFFDELTQRPSLAQTAARSLGFLGMLAALRRRGVRLVWTAHNLAPHELRHPHWAFAVYRTVARWSAAVIAHSAAARAALEDRYGALPHCTVIPHGHYIGRYGPPRERVQARAALDLPAAGQLLLCAGMLRPYKQIEALIDAFAALSADTRGALLIAGQPKDASYAAELARRANAVPGVLLRPAFVPDDELALYLAAADVVALPYRSLLTSGMLLGALSYARPVIAPAFGPVGELVRDGRDGFLFPSRDPDGLRAALARALACPDLDALGQNGLAVAQRFAWPEIARRTAELYRAVVEV
ncbi:MAG TPA: glycosyltransferase [Roseiflexaceae bacterium]|nr:glycosyltransferase [Roseiflexaceae bacterium]